MKLEIDLKMRVRWGEASQQEWGEGKKIKVGEKNRRRTSKRTGSSNVVREKKKNTNDYREAFNIA